MIDVDHFKAVNDRYGHAAGDAVLCEAATRLRETCRESDTIGRYGGEEFIALLPETTAKDAMVAAERIRRAFGDAAFAVDGVEVHLTASIGIAAWAPSMSVPATLYAAADRAPLPSKRARTKPRRAPRAARSRRKLTTAGPPATLACTRATHAQHPGRVATVANYAGVPRRVVGVLRDRGTARRAGGA